MCHRKTYPTDLTDNQWDKIEHLIPRRRDKRGAKTQHSPRIQINAILYVILNRCVWKALPQDFPPHTTVYSYFRKLRRQGIWERILHTLSEKESGNA
jgi:putative transposase